MTLICFVALKKMTSTLLGPARNRKLPEAVLVKLIDESVETRAKDENGFVSIVLISAIFQASK